MGSRSSRLLLIYTIPLILFACGIRTGLLLDTTLLIRVALLTVILLASWIVLLVKKVPLCNGKYESLFLLYYFWGLLSVIWAISPQEALFWSQFVFLGWVLYVVSYTWMDHGKNFEPLFIQTLLVFLILSYGLAFAKMAILKFYDPYKMLGISANNNLYAGFLLLSLGFSFRGYTLFRGFWRWLSFATGIFSLFFIIILQSRAAYVGIFILLLVLLTIVVSRYKKKLTQKHLHRALTATIILAVGVIVFYQSLDTTRKHYFLNKLPVWNYLVSYDDSTLLRLEEERMEIDSLTGMPLFDHAATYYENANLRMIFWSKSVALILKHPLLGVGMGNWRLAIPSVREPANPEHILRNRTYSQPHNEMIGSLTELGIIGFLLAWLVLLLPPGISLTRLLRRKSPDPGSQLFYGASLAGFYVYALFDFPLHRVEHLILLCTTLAILQFRNRTNFPEKKVNGRFPKILTIGFIPLLLVFTLIMAIMRMVGEYHTRTMFSNEHKQDAAVIVASGKAENIFYSLTPNTLPVAWFEGVAWFRLGKYEQALDAFEQATGITPWEVRVLNDYGITLHVTGNTPEAIKQLHQCLVVDPFFDEARFNLAAIWHEQGKDEKAYNLILDCRDSEKRTRYLHTFKK
jgi:tetratricopeptide (TPR) repeat protein